MKLNKRHLRKSRRDRLLMDEMIRANAIVKRIHGRDVYFNKCFYKFAIWFAFIPGRRGLLIMVPDCDSRLFTSCKRNAREYLAQLQGIAADATDV